MNNAFLTSIFAIENLVLAHPVHYLIIVQNNISYYYLLNLSNKFIFLDLIFFSKKTINRYSKLLCVGNFQPLNTYLYFFQNKSDDYLLNLMVINFTKGLFLIS